VPGLVWRLCRLDCSRPAGACFGLVRVVRGGFWAAGPTGALPGSADQRSATPAARGQGSASSGSGLSWPQVSERSDGRSGPEQVGLSSPRLRRNKQRGTRKPCPAILVMVPHAHAGAKLAKGETAPPWRAPRALREKDPAKPDPSGKMRTADSLFPGLDIRIWVAASSPPQGASARSSWARNPKDHAPISTGSHRV
jgi:hypothetical protein